MLWAVKIVSEALLATLRLSPLLLAALVLLVADCCGVNAVFPDLGGNLVSLILQVCGYVVDT